MLTVADTCGDRGRRRLTLSPLAHETGVHARCRGSSSPRWSCFTVAYLVLVEMTKTVFYADPMTLPGSHIAPAGASTASTAAPPASATPAASPTRLAGRPHYSGQSQGPENS